MKNNTVIVELMNDYFVEIDEYNHTLKKRYMGKDKKGKEQEYEKVIGYFNNLKQCVERMTRFLALEELDGNVVTIQEYAEAAENAFEAVKGLAIGVAHERV